MSLLIYFAADASVHADQAHATDDGEVFTERDAFWRERGHTLPPDSSEYILIVLNQVLTVAWDGEYVANNKDFS